MSMRFAAARIAGVLLAIVTASSLSACSDSSSTEDLMVLNNVNKLSCSSTVSASALQATAKRVKGATAKQASDIKSLAGNEGLKSLDDLAKALDAKAKELQDCPTTSPSPSTTASATMSASPTPTTTPDCDPQFRQVWIDRSSTSKVEPRYESAVGPIIAKKTLTNQQRTDAINRVELTLAGSNAQTLAFWSFDLGLLKDPNSWPSLVEGGEVVNGGCLNEAGRTLYAKYEGAITAKGSTVAIGEAPSNGVNTGINGGKAVVAVKPGISGNRTAVVRTLSNGTKMYRMKRCGNGVHPKVPPGVPPGDTDNPPPPPRLVEKDPHQDPYPRGNAPRGGGPNADKGPGVYQDPKTVVRPPSTPRRNPSAPAPKPKPTSGSGGHTVPTKDPARPPAPEPSAPKPTAPETGCVPVPGVVDC